MPRFRLRDASGYYMLKDDLSLEPTKQVRWLFRDPLPTESARLEDSTGFTSFADVRTDDSGERSVQTRWHGQSASVAIEALLLLLTDVQGLDADGRALHYPKGEVGGDDGRSRKATRKDREIFLSQFAQADLIEVGNHLLERRHLTDEQAGN